MAAKSSLKADLLLDTDMIILSIGVAPEIPVAKQLSVSSVENPLAKSCGLALGERGHIKTTKQLQTIDEKTGQVIDDIYAIGDAIQVTDFITGTDTAIPLAWPANRQGRLVADHINGIDISYDGSLGASVLKVFDLTVASVGNNERQLKAKGINYKAIHAHRPNHASYYPGATNIALKLII